MTLNVRGLRDYKKRRKIFNWLPKHNGSNSVIFLQETHCNINNETQWSQQFRGNVYFSNGTNQSCGVMTLIGDKLQFNLVENIIDKNGRYILTKCTINDSEFMLVNVYGPNTETEQVKFYNFTTEQVKVIA